MYWLYEHGSAGVTLLAPFEVVLVDKAQGSWGGEELMGTVDATYKYVRLLESWDPED